MVFVEAWARRYPKFKSKKIQIALFLWYYEPLQRFLEATLGQQ